MALSTGLVSGSQVPSRSDLDGLGKELLSLKHAKAPYFVTLSLERGLYFWYFI
jgi:hypothetical protein